VYRGGDLPELYGWYVYADYCSGDVYAIDAAATNPSPVRLADTSRVYTDFAVTANGELIAANYGAWGSGADAGIYKLERKP
jgi:hypothetical protein